MIPWYVFERGFGRRVEKDKKNRVLRRAFLTFAIVTDRLDSPDARFRELFYEILIKKDASLRMLQCSGVESMPGDFETVFSEKAHYRPGRANA